MDLDGIGAAFLDPRVSLLAGAVEEHWLAAAMCRAYNRRLANYCRPYPDRLFGVAMSFSLFGYGGLDRGGDL